MERQPNSLKNDLTHNLAAAIGTLVIAMGMAVGTHGAYEAYAAQKEDCAGQEISNADKCGGSLAGNVGITGTVTFALGAASVMFGRRAYEDYQTGRPKQNPVI